MTLISEIYVLLAIITLIFYVATYRGEQLNKLIVIYMVLIIVSSIVAMWIIEFSPVKNNLIVFHVFNPLEYALLCFIYLTAFESRIIHTIIKWSVPVILLLSVLFALYIQPPMVNNTYVIMLESVLGITWSLLFLRETIVLQKEEKLQRYPMFWISIGFLFYFIGSLLVEALLNYLIDQSSVELARRAYQMSFIFKYVLFILLMIGSVSRTSFREAQTDRSYE